MGLGRFNPLYRGTWFPTLVPPPQGTSLWKFPSAISRYLVSNSSHGSLYPTYIRFPSAISRYLVSNGSYRTSCDLRRPPVSIRYIAVLGFQLTIQLSSKRTGCTVSIRYIAVLGFQRGGSYGYLPQPYLKNTPSDQRRKKRFTHPSSNRSHSHICFLNFQ